MGLSSWESVLDSNGLSPCAYASTRNNHSYNSLVARKIANRRRNGGVSIQIVSPPQKSCSRCSNRNYYRPGLRTPFRLPYLHSLLVVAAVCVCVCVVARGHPAVLRKSLFSWENLNYSAS
ncbi:hypothetical protein M569_15628 [Genlisea aurea]|uniref:Uncharacterized protein n=1 Tax=Genlisea aurea TaxID=192259 RepID=S8D8Z3_9LAMI|nr:hypothetical protein M569_15628 [Genlisea aurea]